MGKYSAARDLDLKTKTHWYLVASRIGAAIYEGLPGHHFRFVTRMENPKGKLMDTELTSDRSGRSFSSSQGSQIRHGLGRERSPHERAAAHFAGVIGKSLEQAIREERFSDLVILAEPHFLGLIRKELPEVVKVRLKMEIPREFAQGSDAELEVYLKNKLNL